jgi:hypothetical protein
MFLFEMSPPAVRSREAREFPASRSGTVNVMAKVSLTLVTSLMAQKVFLK